MVTDPREATTPGAAARRLAAPDWLGRRARLSPDRLALVDLAGGGREISYGTWDRQANQTARFLQDRLGLRHGDRVAILARNSVAYLDLWYALGKVGGILQTLNWRLTQSELLPLLREGEPIALAFDREFESLAHALADAAHIDHRLQMDGGSGRRGTLPLATRAAYPSHAPAVSVSPDDPWLICYTGGTTGTPKGAVLTHANVLWNAINTVTGWGLVPDDLTVLNAPLFHTGGLNVLTAPLVYIGGASIVCRTFDVAELFSLLREYAVTLLFGVPTMFIEMQRHAGWPGADLTGLRLTISGGAPCPEPVFERFWARGVPFKSGYGLTEAGPNTFWLPPHEVQRKAGVVGAPLFHIDVDLVAEDGRRCLDDEVGELLIRGPHVFAGYWRRPEESAAALRDGWLHTGDLARRDGAGHYTIVGRAKEMFISGGENVYPAEVESVLAGHPAVEEVAVIGVPDPTWGEVGCAIVVPSPAGLEEEALRAYAGERLARYKIPKRVLLVKALPRTGAGKVDRGALLRRAGAGSEG